MTGGRIIAVGVAWWNQKALRALLAAEGKKVTFHDTFDRGLAAARVAGGALVCWASKITPADEAEARAAGLELVFAEDGFLRSVGLGAGLARGCSYVLDRAGIYYDATRASDIETLLETADVGARERQRAAGLRARILDSGMSKYNVGRRAVALESALGRERILVVGQVAVDAGVRRTLSATLDCANSANINLDLLIAARETNPRAYIVYKPHPDVAAALRPGHIDAASIARYADASIADADIITLIESSDRVVTLSSLSGFEALLRGKPVTVHGLPFYAGWGLTDDVTRSPRRTRQRDIDELVAVALLRYARYVDPVTLVPCEPEHVVERFNVQRASLIHRMGAGIRRHASWAGRKLGL